jgi:magnesium transporter
MLSAFRLEAGLLTRIIEPADEQALENSIWIDLAESTPEERQLVEELHQQVLPRSDDLEEIEASSRSYVDERGVHISSMFLQRTEGREETVNVALLLTHERFISLHEPEVAALRLLRMRAARRLTAAQPLDLFLELYEIKLDDLADTLEEIHQNLDEIGGAALQHRGEQMRINIDRLSKHEHRNSKVRLCLVDAQRDLAFMLRHGELDKKQRAHVGTLLRDVDSLLPHCSFLFEKVGFLLQTLQGSINIEQNQIIKIFSVVAVIFLPPTLIASAYGMNFRHMPELDWPWGYPFAILLMILSSIAPYVIFKHKQWL